MRFYLSKINIKLHFILALFIVAMPSALLAHGGRTDSSGGHNDRKAGSYHYHNSGNEKSSSTKSYSFSPKRSYQDHRQGNSNSISPQSLKKSTTSFTPPTQEALYSVYLFNDTRYLVSKIQIKNGKVDMILSDGTFLGVSLKIVERVKYIPTNKTLYPSTAIREKQQKIASAIDSSINNQSKYSIFLGSGATLASGGYCTKNDKIEIELQNGMDVVFPLSRVASVNNNITGKTVDIANSVNECQPK